MSEWITSNILKPYILIECHPKDTINIYSYYNIKFNEPVYIYSYKTMVAKDRYWDSRLNIIEQGNGIIYIDSDDSISESSVISLVIFDNNVLVQPQMLKKNSMWESFGSIKKIKSIKLNKANNFTFELGGFDKNKLFFLPVLTKIKFPYYIGAYTIETNILETKVECSVIKFAYKEKSIETKYSGNKENLTLDSQCFRIDLLQSSSSGSGNASVSAILNGVNIVSKTEELSVSNIKIIELLPKNNNILSMYGNTNILKQYIAESILDDECEINLIMFERW